MFKCRYLVSQNHCLDIRYMHPNSNLITCSLSLKRFPSPNQISQKPVYLLHSVHSLRSHVRLATNSAVEMTMDKDGVRFCIGKPLNGLSERVKKQRRVRVSKKAKLNELRFYRLKAKSLKI
jgi:hypothetical protein